MTDRDCNVFAVETQLFDDLILILCGNSAGLCRRARQ